MILNQLIGHLNPLKAAPWILGLFLVAAATPMALAEEGESFKLADWPAGFYRRTSETTVRYLDGQKRMCTVMNRDQLAAFGGDGIVRVVGPRSGFMNGRTDTGICPWPDGLYRERSWTTWQALYSGGNRRYYCNIVTREHLNAFFLAVPDGKVPLITTLPDRSRLGWRRDWTGDCVWPERSGGSK